MENDSPLPWRASWCGQGVIITNLRGTHEAEATGEVDWWDRTRAENITITITITNLRQVVIMTPFTYVALRGHVLHGVGP